MEIFSILKKNGESIPVFATDSPILDSEGMLKSIVGISVDISEKIQAEQRFKESENTYKSVISSMSEGLMVYDKKGKITFANESACKIFELSYNELIGIDPYSSKWKLLKEDGSPFSGDEHPSVVSLKNR